MVVAFVCFPLKSKLKNFFKVIEEVVFVYMCLLEAPINRGIGHVQKGGINGNLSSTRNEY